jgi:uncharacterized repeat protein (TIGR01451 family)
MKLFKNIKRFARKALAVGAVTTAVLGFGLSAHVPVASAQACDKVNVIYCGLDGSGLSNRIDSFQDVYDDNDSGHASSPSVGHDYHDVQKIFKYAGASDSLVDDMDSDNTVFADVHRNGDITVDGHKIATDAHVAARFSVAGAKHISGTNAYMRSTKSSFAHETERAIIRLDDSGKMLFGVILDCGNAVMANAKEPDYKITKEVRVKGSGDFHSNITIKPGTHVTYRITVKSTGDIPVKNVIVKDHLPSSAHYVNNSLQRDGHSISDSNFFDNGYKISKLKDGDKTVFTFDAVIGEKDTLTSCVNHTTENVASIDTKGLKSKDDEADVTKKCLPKPEYSCKSLTATPGAINQTTGSQAIALKATASVKNATVVSYSYNLGDGSNVVATSNSTTNTLNHTYAPGNYTATVTVTVKDVEGKQHTATSSKCKVNIVVKPLVVLTCDSLTATPGATDASGKRSFSFAAAATATNTTITGYNFSFGDSASTTVPTSATTATTTHTYAPGDYTASVTVTAINNGHATSEACAVPIHVNQLNSSLVCTSLTLVAGAIDETGKQSYTLNAAATADHATITSYVFNFGDSSQATTVTTANTTASTTHVYAPGNWTASVTVFGKDINGHDVQSTTAACQKPVTLNEQPKSPAITITKTVDGVKLKTVKVGQNFVYQLVITNTGEKALTDVAVTDQTPDGVTLVSADLGTIADNDWSYTIPSLAVGASTTVNITAVVKEQVSGNMVNTACVNAPEVNPDQPEENDSCDTATVNVPQVLPTTLVNTGPGSIAGIFGAVAIVSALAHRLYLGRKLAR